MNCYKSTAIIITNEIFFMLIKSMLHISRCTEHV